MLDTMTEACTFLEILDNVRGIFILCGQELHHLGLCDPNVTRIHLRKLEPVDPELKPSEWKEVRTFREA